MAQPVDPTEYQSFLAWKASQSLVSTDTPATPVAAPETAVPQPPKPTIVDVLHALINGVTHRDEGVARVWHEVVDTWAQERK